MASSYLELMPKSERNAYLAKLETFGFHEDLFCDRTIVWEDNPSKWPQLEFGQIFVYLIDTPGPFTKEKLRAYKSLDAYNFFKSGWVQTVFFLPSPNGNFCALKASVMRSQKTTDSPHQAWIILNQRTAEVQRAHCTCMAG